MNDKPIAIYRRCIGCPTDFAIADLSSRAVYCPTCRKEVKRIGMAVSFKSGGYQHAERQAA